MTKKELIDSLCEIIKDTDGDIEINHQRADNLLLCYLDDKEITEAFEAIKKWYA